MFQTVYTTNTYLKITSSICFNLKCPKNQYSLTDKIFKEKKRIFKVLGKNKHYFINTYNPLFLLSLIVTSKIL